MKKLIDIGKILWLGLGLGIIYFSVEIFVGFYFFPSGESLFEEAFSPSLRQMYERTFAFIILAAFTVSAQILFTRVRQAREALKTSEKQMREITAALGEGVYVLDSKARLIFMNLAAERLWGWSEPELLGKEVHELVHYQRADGSPYPDSECPMLGVFQTMKPYRTDADVFTRKDGSMFPASYVVTPILQGNRVIAVVSVFADISERKEAEALSDALDDIHEIIHSTLDFEEIMQLVKKEAALEMRCEATAITLRSDDRWVMKYLHGFPENFTGAVLEGPRASHLDIAGQTQKPVVILDARKDERIDPGLADELGVRSLLSVPLIVKKEVIGDISFAYLSQPVAFSQAQVNFAVKAAAAISLAFENARLYDIERNIAHTLQEAILTLPEAVPGIEIGYTYRSATETVEVGGDFYDVFALEHDKVGITIGDVSGKGLEAAALTSLIKNSVRAYAHVFASPAMIIEKTNHLLVDATEDNVFATLFFGILDIGTGTLTWCRAGHPSPVIAGKATTQVLTEGSPPVGAFEDFTFMEHEHILHPGDTLILYTDGLIEAKRDGVLFGECQLLHTVQKLRRLETRELPAEIFQAVSDFTGGRLSDDVALLAITIKE
ncbi:MAG: SpoIIE family protein phosphatase [Thermoleophilia bacterium]|nr:SpoIIE family protein phosphatase [Thermoleophilia bacterium]